MQALDTLKDEIDVVPGLENLLGLGESIPGERLQHYREVLESVAEAREAAAARLRAQILGISRTYPAVFSTNPTPSATPSTPIHAAVNNSTNSNSYDHVASGERGDDDGEVRAVDRKLFVAEEPGEGEKEDESGSGPGSAPGSGGDAEVNNPAVIGDNGPLPIPPSSGGDDKLHLDDVAQDAHAEVENGNGSTAVGDDNGEGHEGGPSNGTAGVEKKESLESVTDIDVGLADDTMDSKADVVSPDADPGTDGAESTAI